MRAAHVEQLSDAQQDSRSMAAGLWDSVLKDNAL
jgi:hypothetical protein